MDVFLLSSRGNLLLVHDPVWGYRCGCASAALCSLSFRAAPGPCWQQRAERKWEEKGSVQGSFAALLVPQPLVSSQRRSAALAWLCSALQSAVSISAFPNNNTSLLGWGARSSAPSGAALRSVRRGVISVGKNIGSCLGQPRGCRARQEAGLRGSAVSQEL